MAFDAGMMTFSVREMHRAAAGGKIEKIFQPSRDEIVFQIWDDRALGYYPKTPKATSAFNARALSTTNFLTVQGNYTAAKYRNAYCAIKP